MNIDSFSADSAVVFGLGQCCLDAIGQADCYPPADTKCELDALVFQGGGPVATALCALSRWGVSSTFMGVIGDDWIGARIRESLAHDKVDTSQLLVRPGEMSQFAFILAEPGVARRTIFWRRPSGAAPQPKEIDAARLRRARLFYTDGLFVEASLAGAQIARAAGIPVVVDAGTLRDGMRELAQYTDHLIVSEGFARALIGADQPEAACRKLAEYGPTVVGVTLGARGAIFLSAQGFHHQAAYQVAAVDTTGCGDVFHAGYSYGLLQGWPLAQRAEFAAWAAARCSLKLGGRDGIPSLEDEVQGRSDHCCCGTRLPPVRSVFIREVGELGE